AFLLPVAADGATTAESPAPITEELPQEAILTAPVLALEALYPNPSEGNATVAFSLAREGAVRVAVYDALGREVVVAAEGTHQAGRHTASVLDLAAGVYVVRMEADGETFTQRLTVVR
ncbi:MAG: T9SS type A sorting domain-containing protein, partial [Bacteroidota bacterium]